MRKNERLLFPICAIIYYMFIQVSHFCVVMPYHCGNNLTLLFIYLFSHIHH